MLALLSPAKTLDYETPLPDYAHATRPRLPHDAKALADGVAKLSSADLRGLMGISEKLADLNVERYRRFRRQPARPALYAFAGDVYTGFEAATLDEPAIAFAQDHVRILSGLYGMLRPLDAIRPYRLEMGTRWAPDAANLYAHWGNRVSKLLAKDLREDGSGTIINLASQEYWHVVAQAPPRKADIFNIEFMEGGADGPRFVSFNAKKARGMMARYICEHRLEKVADLKGFDSDGYRYDAAASDDRLWRFVRG